MKKKFLAYDLGTTSTKAVLISNDIKIIDASVEDYKTHFPKPGYAEHDPDDWWRTLVTTTKRLMSKTNTSPDDLAAISFSSQMQGLLPIDNNH
ncbi:MAG: xylulokinase, partial [Candidatus Heimdallarchaeota archaeon]|nr:xylulokinase [Candidatus Heimdallarchaeota archaeon]